jgi:protein-S-isoprenylcysteine O-methyltransferase Ste14
MHARLQANVLRRKAKRKPWGTAIVVVVCLILTYMHFDAMFSSDLPPTPIQYIISLLIVLAAWILLARSIFFGNALSMDP